MRSVKDVPPDYVVLTRIALWLGAIKPEDLGERETVKIDTAANFVALFGKAGELKGSGTIH